MIFSDMVDFDILRIEIWVTNIRKLQLNLNYDKHDFIANFNQMHILCLCFDICYMILNEIYMRVTRFT